MTIPPEPRPSGPSISDLIDKGYLVPARLYSPLDLDPSLIWRGAPAIVEAYRKIMPGKRAIVFAYTQEHAARLAKQFNDEGILAFAHTGAQSPAERKARLESFIARRCEVLVVISLPDVITQADGVIIARHHGSAGLFETQMLAAMGPQYAEGMPRDTHEQRRAAIKGSNKTVSLILDMGDNLARHPDRVGRVLHTPADEAQAQRDWNLSVVHPHSLAGFKQLQQRVARLDGNLHPHQVEAIREVMAKHRGQITMQPTDPMRYHHTPDTFTAWMNHHGQEAIQAGLGAEELMEGAYAAGHRAGGLPGGGGAGEVADLRARLLAATTDIERLVEHEYERCERIGQLRRENEALACGLRGKHELTGATYQLLVNERDDLRAQLAAHAALIADVLAAFQLDVEGRGSCLNPGLDFIQPWAARVAALSTTPTKDTNE